VQTSKGHPLTPSPYWTGGGHAIRYVCSYCAEWFDKPEELYDHLETEHDEGGVVVDGVDLTGHVKTWNHEV